MQNRVDSPESTDSTKKIANFAFDFDGSLNNLHTVLALNKALKNEEFRQFLQAAHDNNYTVTKKEIAAQYNKVATELAQLSLNELKNSELTKEAFLPHDTRKQFANIINKLDDRFFAMLIIISNPIFEEYIKLCKDKGIEYVALTVFSNRGDFEHDKKGMVTNASPSAYTMMDYIAKYFESHLPGVKVRVNQFCANDIFGKKARGTSFKEIVEAHQTDSFITQNNFIFDKTKLTLQYLIAHDLEGLLEQFDIDPKAIELNQVEVTLCFSDDLKEVILKEEPPILFPSNTEIIKTVYEGYSEERIRVSFRGTGDLDPNFRENVFSLFKAAGYSSAHLANRAANDFDVCSNLRLDEFLKMRKLITVGVINIDDYLQNINYENLVVDIIMKHGELLEQCEQTIKTTGSLSEEDEEALNQIVNASMSIRLDDSLSLSRDLASSTGLLAASTSSVAAKRDVLVKAFPDVDLSNMPAYADCLNTIATNFSANAMRLSMVGAPLLKVSIGALTDQAEVVRDLCVVKYNQLMASLAKHGKDLKEGVLFSGYRAIFKLLQEKLGTQVCQHFHLATHYTPNDALHEHIVYIKENARFFSVSCGIDIVPFSNEPQQKAGYQFVPISMEINKPTTCYREGSSCLMWSTSSLGSFSSLSIQEGVVDSSAQVQEEKLLTKFDELDKELNDFECVGDAELDEFEYISATPH